MTDSDPADRLKLADRFDRYARHIVFAAVPLALIAVVDLLTGWLLDDPLIDIVLIVAAGMCLWGAFSVRRLARLFRAGDLPSRLSLTQVAWSLASMAAALAFTAAVGYLIGGWLLAVVLPLGEIVVIAVATAIGIRRRRVSLTRSSQRS